MLLSLVNNAFIRVVWYRSFLCYISFCSFLLRVCFRSFFCCARYRRFLWYICWKAQLVYRSHEYTGLGSHTHLSNKSIRRTTTSLQRRCVTTTHKQRRTTASSFPVPAALHELLTVRSQQATNITENIRQYNNAFAFASMGAKIAQLRGRGPYCFSIHGQIYHQSGTLPPPQGTNHGFGQVYILEGHQAVES